MEIIDPTGTPLTPSWHGERCLGNGEHPEYECCCDECDYFLRCFPEYDWLRFRRIVLKGHLTRWRRKTFKLSSNDHGQTIKGPF